MSQPPPLPQQTPQPKKPHESYFPLRVRGLNAALTILVIVGVIGSLLVPKSVLATVPLIVICGLTLTISVSGLSTLASPLPLRQYTSRSWLLGLSTLALPIFGLPPTFSLSSSGADLFVRFLMIGYAVMYVPASFSVWLKARECHGGQEKQPDWFGSHGQSSSLKNIFTTRRVIGVIVVLVVVRGCFWGSEATETDNIVGKWTQGDSTVEFTDGGKFILTVDSSDAEPTFGTYKLDDSRLIVDGDGLGFYEVEFRSTNELLVVADYQERELEGSWQRLGVATSVEDIASLDDAGRSAAIRSQIKDLQKRRASIQELIKKAVTDKSGLVVRLKQSGVNSSSDLKSNPTARRIAQELVRLTREIQSLQRDALRLDEAVGKAESLVRRIEQSKVAISSQEFSSLTGELLTAAEIQDGSAANSSPDPISLDTLLNEALTSTPHMTSTGSSQLLGKWERKGPSGKTHSLEFTNGNSVISTFVGERIGTYALDRSTLTTTDDEGQTSQYNLQFLSSNEVIFRTNRKSYSDFDDLVGRWSKVK